MATPLKFVMSRVPYYGRYSYVDATEALADVYAAIAASAESDGADDVLTPITATISGGSNPPVFSRLLGSGEVAEGFGLEFFSSEPGYVSIPHIAQLDVTSDFSIELWYNNSPTGGGLDRDILDKDGSVRASINANTQLLKFRVNGLGTITSAVSLDAGRWYHLAFVAEDIGGGDWELRLYIDGIERGDGTFTGTPTANSEAITVGARDGNSAVRRIDGKIDELAWWGKALSNAEVLGRYGGGSGTATALVGDETDLVSVYHLDENNGTTAGDSSANLVTPNDGTLMGDPAPHWVAGIIGSPESHGVYVHLFGPDEEQEVFFSMQLPHKRVPGSNLNPHIHWVAPDEGSGQAVFALEYTWASIGSVFPNTTTDTVVIAPGTPFTHEYASFPIVDGSNLERSAMMLGRLYRDVNDERDTYDGYVGLMEFDIHVRVGRFGDNPLIYGI